MSATTNAVVDVGGLPMVFAGSDPRRAGASARLLVAAPPHPDPAEITFRYLRRRPGTPRRRADHEYEGMRVWHDGVRLVVQTAWGAGAVVTPERAWIGGEPDDLDAAWRQLFHFAVTHVLAHRHRFVVHAAGIVDPSGRAFVVLGDSGQGKSTLALAGLRRGWRLLSDDLVVVRRAAGDLDISGIPRRLCVPGDVVRSSGVEIEAEAVDERGRHELAADHLTPGWFPAAGVVVVGHGHSPDGELRALPNQETLDRILRGFSSATDPVLFREFFPIAAALTRLGGHWLGHGTVTDTRLAVAERLLAEAAQSSSGRSNRSV